VKADTCTRWRTSPACCKWSSSNFITQEKWSKKELTAAQGVENAASASCSRNGGSSAPRHRINSNPKDSMPGTPSHSFTYVYEYIKQICISMYILYIYIHIKPSTARVSDTSFKKTFCLMNIRPQDLLSHEQTLWSRLH